MADWRPWIDTFLLESLRFHGRGYDYGPWKCDTCDVVCSSTPGQTDDSQDAECEIRVDVTGTQETAVPSYQVTELYKCRTCGSFNECSTCCLKRHQRTPLHKVEVCITHPTSIFD